MIEWDWKLERPLLYMDIETQSPVDLRKHGARAYLTDPDTRLASAVFLIDNIYHVWIPPGRCPIDYQPKDTDSVKFHYDEGIPQLIKDAESSHTWVAHNAESFDAQAWEIFFPDSKPRWVDTLHLCRFYGYPGSLDAASKAMGGRGKADTRAMHLITEARIVAGKARYNVTTSALWKQFIDYNIQDVEELKYIADHVCTKPKELEHDILRVSSIINARGVRIDVPYARALRDTWLLLRNDAADQIAEMTGGALTRDNIKSPKAVKNYLSSLGFNTDTIANSYVNQIIKDPELFLREVDDDDAGRIVAVLALRQDAVRATAGKIDRVFKVLHSDECVRFLIQYYGAGTGRYSGRDLQPHNFARGFELGSDIEYLLMTENMTLDNVIKVSEKHKHPQLDRHLQPAEVLSTFTRSIIRPRPGKLFAPIDYMGIEARMVAWLANCERALSIFADPKRDIYCDMASALFGRTVTKDEKALRQVGKIVVLGCIAEDSNVLTSEGWYRIQDVTQDMRVWDGVDFVNHAGLQCSGVKPCVKVLGTWLTPDHKILTDSGWVRAWQLKENTRYPLKANRAASGQLKVSSPENVGGVSESYVDALVALLLQSSLIISYLVNPLDATLAPSERVVQRKLYTMSSFRITRTVRDCLIGYLQSLVDAKLNPISDMAREVLECIRRGSKTAHNFYTTLQRLRDGIIQTLKLIDKTTNADTNPAIYDSLREVNRCEIHLVTTYDIKTCGRKNRFQVDSIIAHNCGYGMAAKTFQANANNLLVNLSAVNVTAEQCIKTYRETYHEIKKLWREYDQACHYAVKHPGVKFNAGKCVFCVYGSFLTILMPSGRYLRYRNARLVLEPPKWDLSAAPMWQVVYDGPFGYRKSLYGGLIAENVTQAISRDILCGALVRLDGAGFECVLHVHDEACLELNSHAELPLAAKIMVDRPNWCADAPMGVEGFTHELAYTKEPGKNSEKVRMLAC